MRTFYFNKNENFGDHLNSWLWPRLFPDQLAGPRDDVLIGIGTLLKTALNNLPGRKIVFGTGTGYGDIPLPEAVADWLIYFVRGPLTARALGIEPDKAIVDGAWLVDHLDDVRYRPGERKGIVFVPHYVTDLNANWQQPCADAGIRYVSPLIPDPVLPAIAGAELAIVESMHGAIMADYYRVPWIPVATDQRVLSFKWIDFCSSVGLDFRPIGLPVSDPIERVITGKAAGGRKGIHYLPQASVDFDRIRDVVPVRPSQSASFARSIGRKLRHATQENASKIRSISAYKGLYGSRSKDLAGLLLAIAKEPAHLSADAVRERKLDQLNTQVEKLRRDFPNG